MRGAGEQASTIFSSFFWQAWGRTNTGFNVQHMWKCCRTKGSTVSLLCVCVCVHTSAHCHTFWLLWPLLMTSQTRRLLTAPCRIRQNAIWNVYLAGLRSYALIDICLFSTLSDSSHRFAFPRAVFPPIRPLCDVVILTAVQHNMRRCANTFSRDDSCCHSCSYEWSL